MVGQPSAQLESSGTGNTLDKDQESAFDISEYLLLHHNYAAKPPGYTTKRKTTIAKHKYKAIKPKSDILNTTCKTIENNTLSPNLLGNDSIQNANETNIVTLLMDDIDIGEPIIEITTTEEFESSEPIPDYNSEGNNEEQFDLLNVPSVTIGNRSPMSSCGSDYGYESLDSPCSVQDLWDQSITELFPSLL